MDRITLATTNDSPQAAITLTLLCHSNQSHMTLAADPGQSVGGLLEELLQRLERGENGEHFARLRECYEPILQRLEGNEAIALENHHTLDYSGLRHGDQIQIAARPIKESLLFCRYSERG